MSSILRAEVIAKFRNRIRNAVHFRLSTDDLNALIKGFIEELKGAKSETKIRALCEAEIKLLEEGYPQPSVAKYLTRYRKAISAAIEDGVLRMSKATSHYYVHQQRVTGILEERQEHWALTYLKYSAEVYESFDNRPQPTDSDETMNLPQVPVEQYLELLQGFLAKRDKFEARWLATALAGVTGRRFADLIATGAFSLTEHPYVLHFEQRSRSRFAKKKTDNIVTLIPAADVLKAIRRLRRHPEVSAITKLKGTEQATALTDMNRKLNLMFEKSLRAILPPLEGKKTVSFNTLRNLYGTIAVHFFCPEHQSEDNFIRNCLGNVATSLEPGQHHYQLTDAQGSILRKTGSLLNRVPELPSSKAQTSLIAEAQDEHSDVPIAETLPDAQPELAEAQPPQSKDEKQPTMKTVEIGKAKSEEATLDSPQTIPAAWRSELERGLEQLRTEFQAEIQELRQDSHAGWHMQRIEALERENLHLLLERDRAVESAQKAAAAEIEQVKAEKELIAQELKQAQDKLNRFRQLLGVDTEDSEASPVEVQQPASDAAEPTERERQLASSTEPSEALVNRSPYRGKAFKRAEAIVQAIKEWNQLYPTNSFVVNPGILENTFKVHRQAIRDFLSVYDQELQDYHQVIGVESPRWHNRGKDIEKLKDFVLKKITIQEKT